MTGKPVKMTKHKNIYSQRIDYRIKENKMYSKHIQNGQKSITLPQNQPISFKPQVISHSALPYLDNAVIFTMVYNSFPFYTWNDMFPPCHASNPDFTNGEKKGKYHTEQA